MMHQILSIKKILKMLLNRMGYDIVKKSQPTATNNNVILRDVQFMEIYEKCKNYTMTSIERMYALYKAIQYIIRTEIKGEFVECGVWRGGSAMLMAYTLISLENFDKAIYLFDTFKGMTEPEKIDREIRTGAEAFSTYEKYKKNDRNEWCYAPLEEVKKNMLSTGYPAEKIMFIEGDILETIPGYAPEEISLLRLDTDWYASTKHELEHLYPRLVNRGVLIVDDYGHWEGAKLAFDEYFYDKVHYPIFVDYTGLVLLKLE